MERTLRALRGAITLDEDTKDQVIDRSVELLRAMLERNDIEREDLVSVIFTATPDIRSEFPAAAARSIGISDVPLLCAQEIDVEGAVALCIRILMHMTTDRDPADLRHIYLRGAEPLRTDLPR